MEGIYEVTYRGQAVGTAEITREGLYLRIFARCRISDNEIHRLYADGEKIGVLMPDRGGLTLETRLPAKRLKEGCAFSLDERAEQFIPIRSGENFEYLDKLRKGRMGFRDGILGLIL